ASDDSWRADVDAPANVVMSRGRDPIGLSSRRSRAADLIAHLVEPEADVLGVPIANARSRSAHGGPLIARERATRGPRTRVRPRIGIASALGRQVPAEQAAVRGTAGGVVDDRHTLVAEDRCDLACLRT